MPKKLDLTGAASNQNISVDELKRHVNRYAQERLTHLVHHIGADSKQLWINRSKLEEFLGANPNANGIRIYFGVTDTSAAGFTGGVHNLVLVPTQFQANEDTDMLTDEDTVLVFEALPETTITKALATVCPPPLGKCPGTL